jgi:hypothetical protein
VSKNILKKCIRNFHKCKNHILTVNRQKLSHDSQFTQNFDTAYHTCCIIHLYFARECYFVSSDKWTSPSWRTLQIHRIFNVHLVLSLDSKNQLPYHFLTTFHQSIKIFKINWSSAKIDKSPWRIFDQLPTSFF